MNSEELRRILQAVEAGKEIKKSIDGLTDHQRDELTIAAMRLLHDARSTFAEITGVKLPDPNQQAKKPKASGLNELVEKVLGQLEELTAETQDSAQNILGNLREAVSQTLGEDAANMFFPKKEEPLHRHKDVVISDDEKDLFHGLVKSFNETHSQTLDALLSSIGLEMDALAEMPLSLTRSAAFQEIMLKMQALFNEADIHGASMDTILGSISTEAMQSESVKEFIHEYVKFRTRPELEQAATMLAADSSDLNTMEFIEAILRADARGLSFKEIKSALSSEIWSNAKVQEVFSTTKKKAKKSSTKAGGRKSKSKKPKAGSPQDSPLSGRSSEEIFKQLRDADNPLISPYQPNASASSTEDSHIVKDEVIFFLETTYNDKGNYVTGFNITARRKLSRVEWRSLHNIVTLYGYTAECINIEPLRPRASSYHLPLRTKHKKGSRGFTAGRALSTRNTVNKLLNG